MKPRYETSLRQKRKMNETNEPIYRGEGGACTAELPEAQRIYDELISALLDEFRKRTAYKFGNPRIRWITFHTLRALEGHDGIPQDEGHPLRVAAARPQEHQGYLAVHAAGEPGGGRICLRGGQNAKGDPRADRERL